jgi:periplasmic protein CpxP/Spy
MMRRGTILVLVLTAIAGAGVLAVRAGHHAIATGGFHKRPTELSEQLVSQAEAELPMAPGRGRGLLQDLNLSPEQLEKVRQIRMQYRDRLRTEREAAQRAQKELQDLMASTASTAQVRERYQQVQTLRDKVAATQFESMLAMREVLTLEQRKKIVDRMQPGKRFRGRMRENGPANENL